VTDPTEENTDMSTKMSARGVVGSLRLIGVTAAMAAGIAGFATVDAARAPQLDLAAAAHGQACDHASDRALARSTALAECATDQDMTDGVDPIFGDGPVFGEAPAHGHR
jgi:hypothetical protein